VDLRDGARDDARDKLLAACGSSLGTNASHWLAVRDQLCECLKHNRSVNLIVSGNNVAWRGLIDHLARDCFPGLVRVDLHSARTIDRPVLLQEMLSGGTIATVLPAAPRDLARFQEIIEARPGVTLLVLKHFDLARYREYGIDFLSTLRYLVTEVRKLVVLIQSRTPFLSLVPEEHRVVLSSLILEHIELRGRL
jgi:hypothetical protein